METLSDIYSDMSWDKLIALRNKIPKDNRLQDILAPYEHRAYMREQVGQNPFMAIPYSLMIPSYQLSKGLGISSGTKPSLEQLLQGYRGIYEGLTR